MHTKKPALHLMFVKLFESFKQVVKPTSKKPAIINIIQLIIQIFVAKVLRIKQGVFYKC
ncbi:hypothetical protein D3C87_149840 [compost metagenome]